MKWRLISVLFLLGSLVSISPAAPAVEAGDQAPAWRGTSLADRDVVFPDAAARQTSVLVFWATWCNYCHAFMPYLAAIQKEYGDRNVQVLAINAKEEEGADPKVYMDRNGYDLVTIRNGDAIARAYGVEFIPGLFVVDADGRVIYRRGWTDLPAGRQVAEVWDAQVRSTLRAALEK